MHRRSFTLVELMVAVAIMGVVSSMMVMALNSASADAKRARTQGVIRRLSEVMLTLYDEEASRRLPVAYTVAPSSGYALRSAKLAGLMRIMVMRDHLRIALPDRRSDLLVPPASIPAQLQSSTSTSQIRFVSPELRTQIRARFLGRIASLTGVTLVDPTAPTTTEINNLRTEWTEEHEASECLYLILTITSIDGIPALEDFATRDIVDTDGDGIPEVLDAWGTPIAWMRWPVGYWLTYGTYGTVEQRAAELGVDSIDYIRSDLGFESSGSEWTGTTAAITDNAFNLLPVVVSAGPDGIFDLALAPSVITTTSVTSDPLTGYGTLTRPGPTSTPPDPPYIFGTTIPYPDPYCRGSTLPINQLLGALWDEDFDGDDSVDNLFSLSP